MTSNSRAKTRYNWRCTHRVLPVQLWPSPSCRGPMFRNETIKIYLNGVAQVTILRTEQCPGFWSCHPQAQRWEEVPALSSCSPRPCGSQRGPASPAQTRRNGQARRRSSTTFATFGSASCVLLLLKAALVLCLLQDTSEPLPFFSSFEDLFLVGHVLGQGRLPVSQVVFHLALLGLVESPCGRAGTRHCQPS